MGKTNDKKTNANVSEEPQTEQAINENNGKLNIFINEKTVEGTYANLVVTRFSPGEFILDFINVMPNAAQHKVKARIVMSPQNTKRLLRELDSNIHDFEQENGEIKDVSSIPLPLHLGGPDAQA